MITLEDRERHFQTKREALDWFEQFLDDVITWDQYPMSSVLEDFGKIKELSNVLIKFKDEFRNE